MQMMTTMQIGKDNRLQIPYVENVFAWVRQIDWRAVLHFWVQPSQLARLGRGRIPLCTKLQFQG